MDEIKKVCVIFFAKGCDILNPKNTLLVQSKRIFSEKNWEELSPPQAPHPNPPPEQTGSVTRVSEVAPKLVVQLTLACVQKERLRRASSRRRFVQNQVLGKNVEKME